MNHWGVETIYANFYIFGFILRNLNKLIIFIIILHILFHEFLKKKFSFNFKVKYLKYCIKCMKNSLKVYIFIL